MTRHRFSRIFASVGLAVSLSLSMVALPAVVLGALPDVSIGYGTNADATSQPGSGAVPAKVDKGEPAAFQIWARNDDTSTISQFFLSIDADGGTLSSATWSKSSGQSGTCSTTTAYDCSFGQLKPDVTVYVTVVITTPTVGSTMVPTFVFSTTGIGSGGGDNSHGDTWSESDSVSLDGTDDYAGRYVNSSGVTMVQNNQVLGTGNAQSTIVYSPETGIGVTVEDGLSCGEAGTCVGEASEISVANGKSYTNGFKVVINLHSSEIPSGVNANNITVWHDGVQITDKCGKTPSPDCYSTKKFSWGIQVTIWLTHNGKITFA
jgi:hypothetical protein